MEVQGVDDVLMTMSNCNFHSFGRESNRQEGFDHFGLTRCNGAKEARLTKPGLGKVHSITQGTSQFVQVSIATKLVFCLGIGFHSKEKHPGENLQVSDLEVFRLHFVAFFDHPVEQINPPFSDDSLHDKVRRMCPDHLLCKLTDGQTRHVVVSLIRPRIRKRHFALRLALHNSSSLINFLLDSSK